MLEAPESLLRDRRLMGLDLFDEVWEGVLHMVPPPSAWHQRFGTELLVALVPLAKAKGLVALYETGLYRPEAGERDYRTPDLIFARQEHLSKRGVEGKAELVIEILSPGDESREKLPFYESAGVGEVVLVDPESRELELYALRGGRLYLVLPDASGAVRSQALGVVFRRTDEPRLRLEWEGGSATV